MDVGSEDVRLKNYSILEVNRGMERNIEGCQKAERKQATGCECGADGKSIKAKSAFWEPQEKSRVSQKMKTIGRMHQGRGRIAGESGRKKLDQKWKSRLYVREMGQHTKHNQCRHRQIL